MHDALIQAFKFSVQSTKHPSFKEGRKWRAIYSPASLQRQGLMTDQQIGRVPTEIMSINGVPQRVYGVRFQNYPDEGFEGATVPEIIDRVLIGPSADGYAIGQAYVARLGELGVSDAHTKVWITGVPLRN